MLVRHFCAVYRSREALSRDSMETPEKGAWMSIRIGERGAERGVFETSFTRQDGSKQVEKVDLGEFYRSCLTSKGPRYGCIGNCPRSYLDPQGMLDDVGLFNTLSAQMQGEVMLLHPILVTRVLKDLKTCPCNNLRNWLLLHLCATSLRQTAACFKIVHDPQHSAQLYSAAVTLSKYMHKKSSIEDKLRGLHETTGRITDICNDMEKWIEWEACRCQHKLCPINAIAEQNMQKASLEVLHALQESRPQLNSALKMAANDTQKQKLLLDWTNVIWAHTHALMVSIIKSNLEPITTRLADDLIVQEAAQKSSKGKKQARNKPATLAPSAHQHADNCESVDALFICPLTKVRLQDPVIAADGHTYERQAMERWVSTSDVSPATGAKLKHTRLVPNVIIRSMLAM